MSEPPDPPPTLDYRAPDRHGLPTGVQAFLGAIITLVALAALCFIAGWLSVAATDGKDGSAVVLILIGLGVFGGMITGAIFMNKNPEKRGWAIGMFIGIGLGLLLWGVCGLFLTNISNI